MNDFIPYGRQSISDEDLAAVADVLRSNWLTTGPAVSNFESKVKNYCKAQHAVACSSATAALHLACLALGLGPGDLLWTVPNTFVASANCARYCGADVDFVDIDPDTLNLSVDELRQKLEQADRLPSVVVPVHFGGSSCDMAAIKALADQYGFKIIEDASHAIGGQYKNSAVGNCQYSDMAVFSFHPVKIITTGEGGVVTTNDSALAERLQLFRSHGVTRDSALMDKEAEGDWYYQQVDLGFNYRITDMQCALGLSQFSRLDQFVERRNNIVQRYHELLADLPLEVQQVSGDVLSAYHLYVIQLDTGIDRKAVFDHLRTHQIGVNVHYIPVHTQPYYQNLGFKIGDFPNAEAYYAGAISLPVYADLTDEQQTHVVEKLKEAIGL